MSETESTQPRSRWQRFSPSMGWKAFWSEILIVVIGVAIALAASEAVQEWSWRNKVIAGEARLKDDTGRVFVWAAEHVATEPCVDAQLAALTERLLASGSTSDHYSIVTEGNLRFVVRMAGRPFTFPTWDALVADGTAAHFPADRQALFNRISGGMAYVRTDHRVAAIRLTSRLLALGHPIALDPGVSRDFLTDLEELRARNASMSLTLQQLMVVIADAGGVPAEIDVDALFANSGTMRFCRAQGLPLADWRAYRTAGSLQPAAPQGSQTTP